MELNRILQKIDSLMKERGWSMYRLAKESGIPYSSLNSLFLKNNHPTIPTLEKICAGLHITMSEFFDDSTPYRADTFRFSKEELEFLNRFHELPEKRKKALMGYLIINSELPQ